MRQPPINPRSTTASILLQLDAKHLIHLHHCCWSCVPSNSSPAKRDVHAPVPQTAKERNCTPTRKLYVSALHDTSGRSIGYSTMLSRHRATKRQQRCLRCTIQLCWVTGSRHRSPLHERVQWRNTTGELQKNSLQILLTRNPPPANEPACFPRSTSRRPIIPPTSVGLLAYIGPIPHTPQASAHARVRTLF